MNCINCHTEFESDFCPTCGQSKKIKKISFQTIITGLVESFSNMDKGYLKNLRQMTLHPKETVIGYVNGKRVRYYHPISFAILNISIFLAISVIFNTGDSRSMQDFIFNRYIKSSNLDVSYSLSLLDQYLDYFWFLLIFPLSLFTYFLQSKYNIFEHIVVNSFVVGHSVFIGLIFFPLIPQIFGNPIISIAMVVLLYRIYKKRKIDIAGFIKVILVLIGANLLLIITSFLLLMLFAANAQ